MGAPPAEPQHAPAAVIGSSAGGQAPGAPQLSPVTGLTPVVWPSQAAYDPAAPTGLSTPLFSFSPLLPLPQTGLPRGPSGPGFWSSARRPLLAAPGLRSRQVARPRPPCLRGSPRCMAARAALLPLKVCSIFGCLHEVWNFLVSISLCFKRVLLVLPSPGPFPEVWNFLGLPSYTCFSVSPLTGLFPEVWNFLGP